MKKKKFLEKRNIWNGRRAKSGETLVEVMVSVVIFLLLVATLQGSVAFCSNAQQKSREIRENTAAAITAYWNAADSGKLDTKSGSSVTLQFQTSEFVSAFNVEVTPDSSKVTTGSGDSVTFYTYGNGAD